MTVYVTAISPPTAEAHELVTGLRWLDSNNSTSTTMTVAQAVRWIRRGGTLLVAGERGPVKLAVVDTTPPHVRTVADGGYGDNLLALPRY